MRRGPKGPLGMSRPECYLSTAIHRGGSCGLGRADNMTVATTGLEVLHELKSDATTDDIPVIIVSAYGTLMNEQDAHQAAGVIQKPFDYDDLVAQVERATARTLEVAL